MDWIKRNLFFVIGAVVSLVLMGLAGFYTWSGWKENSEQSQKLREAYEEANRLSNKNPHPGDGKKVNNINLAKEQQKETRDFIGKISQHFQPILAVPQGGSNITSEAYASALRLTIDQLQRDATNNSVILPERYPFSFTAQRQLIKFAPGSLEPLAVQLGEVRAICSVLNAAKINALDGIRRERVSADDNSGSPTDYLDLTSTTNELAVLTPYEVTFRCFTPELASVLMGIASSPHGIVVKSINVEPAVTTLLAADGSIPQPLAAPVYVPQQPLPQPRRVFGEEGPSDAFASRYGRPGGYPTPAPQPVAVAPGTAVPVRSSLKTILSERQIKVTMMVQVVKLLPKQ